MGARAKCAPPLRSEAERRKLCPGGRCRPGGHHRLRPFPLPRGHEAGTGLLFHLGRNQRGAVHPPRTADPGSAPAPGGRSGVRQRGPALPAPGQGGHQGGSGCRPRLCRPFRHEAPEGERAPGPPPPQPVCRTDPVRLRPSHHGPRENRMSGRQDGGKAAGQAPPTRVTAM